MEYFSILKENNRFTLKKFFSILKLTDIKYFGALFKKTEEMSPAIYKKSMMKNTEQN